MKKSDLNKELTELNAIELKAKVIEWRRQLLSLRLNAATSHVKDFSQFNKLKKNIARGLTHLQFKESTLNEKELTHE
ncbi:MAG: ribosomal protein L29 [Alteromonas naphthalenivorans]|jgi:ribosomal protein L29